ncbi:MAG: bifunctional oligoribonuclease and phosphatase NrnA [Frankiales bacterium]|nr:bifunctional oligoribonuclease and phosphatase NrnA [Frankiales bacterium]
MTTRPTEQDWQRATQLLHSADDVVVACHVSPDGDALGSALAVGIALSRLGKRVRASFGDDPFVVPEVLDFLPGTELLVPPADVPEAPELLVTFDTGSADRLGLLANRVPAALCCLVVDHHATNTNFGTDLLLDTAAAATATMALELVDRLGVALDKDIATCVYTGLTTDTGSFRFAATTPDVHRVAARLLEAGVEHDLIARRIFDTKSFGYLRLLGCALSRATLEPQLVWTSVTAQDRREHGVPMDLVEAVIGVLRITAERDVAVVFKEDDAGRWVVSTRSKGEVDVGSVCAALGGGGHRYAAGFTGSRDLEETLGRLRAALPPAP